MMNQKHKYYDLILETITSHRKYSMYEAVAKEIEDEVISQVGDILDEIEDENVARNYLQRIVSTAMVTVPRRLNITRRSETVQQEVVVNQPEIVENTVESISAEVDENEASEEILPNNFDENLSPEVHEIEEITANTGEVDLLQEENDVLLNEEPITVVHGNSEEYVSDEISERNELPEVDLKLVGDFINGIDNNSAEITEMSEENLPINDLYPQRNMMLPTIHKYLQVQNMLY